MRLKKPSRRSFDPVLRDEDHPDCGLCRAVSHVLKFDGAGLGDLAGLRA
jgi:hypothetical protein